VAQSRRSSVRVPRRRSHRGRLQAWRGKAPALGRREYGLEASLRHLGGERDQNAHLNLVAVVRARSKTRRSAPVRRRKIHAANSPHCERECAPGLVPPTRVRSLAIFERTTACNSGSSSSSSSSTSSSRFSLLSCWMSSMLSWASIATCCSRLIRGTFVTPESKIAAATSGSPRGKSPPRTSMLPVSSSSHFRPRSMPFRFRYSEGPETHEQGALGAFDLTREREAAECGLADKARDSVRRVRGVEIVVAAVVAGEPREQAATRVHLDVLRVEADGGDTTAGERVDDLGGVDDTLGDFLPLRPRRRRRGCQSGGRFPR